MVLNLVVLVNEKDGEGGEEEGGEVEGDVDLVL